ncbi:hypothetical protein SCLCIDRAFT_1208527 [Scleroderma citrinum Foug A]|uniref:Uncharacterized protein n=1 Tax=Scleroderma citrinum Foug A TaxID=1036808 RepID=A0A0C3ELQ5_9AGAM|nr:hypothetical protein SCLCIDRAFT_1208527 [Scleroderma citrinum Foug A]
MMLFKSTLLLLGVGFAAAQSISSGCTSALVSIAGSPDSACLNPSALVQLVLTNSSTSVVPVIDTWLTGLCALGPCSNSSLQAVFTNLTAGCPTELQALGLPTNNSNSVTYLQAAYPTIRQVLCLKDTSANELCATEDLTQVQNVTGTLTTSNIASVVGEISAGNQSIPQSVTCGNCSKAAYTIASKNFPDLISGTKNETQATCGSSFTDGQTPSGIEETASNSTSTSGSGSGSGNTGGAARLDVSSLNIGLSMVIAVSSVFAFFA